MYWKLIYSLVIQEFIQGRRLLVPTSEDNAILALFCGSLVVHFRIHTYNLAKISIIVPFSILFLTK